MRHKNRNRVKKDGGKFDLKFKKQDGCLKSPNKKMISVTFI